MLLSDKKYVLVCKKKKPVYFDDELKIGDVRYKHLIYKQLKYNSFDVYHMNCNFPQK